MSQGPIRVSALILAVGLMFGAAACGSEDSSKTTFNATASSAGSHTDTAGGGVQAAKAMVQKAMTGEGYDYNLPTKPVDPGGNKRVMIISIGQATATGPTNQEAKIDAVKAIGWTPSQIYDSQFDMGKVSSLIEQGIQEKYDAIFLDGVQPPAIAGALKAAAQAKIAVLCMQCVSGDLANKYLIDSRSDYKQAGRLEAAYTVDRLGGKGKILGFVDHSYVAIETLFKGYSEEMKQDCPDCDVKLLDYNAASTAEPGPPEFSAALSTNPKGAIQAVQAPYDFAAIPMLKTAQQHGRDDMLISGIGATNPFRDLLRSKAYPNIGSTATDPPRVMAYFLVDALARTFANQPISDGLTSIPPMLVTEQNVGEFNKFLDPPGFDYDAFLRLWGRR